MSARSIIFAGALAALTQAYTPPTTATWGPLLTPDLTDPVTQGTTAQVTWDPESHPTDGVTVSLVLCHGPSNNCVPATNAIVEGLPAAQKSYSWAVPSDLAPGTQSTDTGYGMLIIVDGTGEFQYSTQFSVLAAGGSSGSSSTTKSPTTSSVTSAATPGGWTSLVGPGQGGYSNSTTTAATSMLSAPSSIVSATGMATMTTLGATITSGYATATPPSSATQSVFPGAGVKVQVGGLFGAVMGGLALLAL